MTALAAAVVLILALLLLRVGSKRGHAWELAVVLTIVLLLAYAGFLSRSPEAGADVGSAAAFGLVLVGGMVTLFAALEISERANMRPLRAQLLGLAAVGGAVGLLAAGRPAANARQGYDLSGGGGQPAVLLAFVLVVVLAMGWTGPVAVSRTVLPSRVGWSAVAAVGFYAYSRDLGATLMLLSGLVGVVLATRLAWRQAAIAAAALVALVTAGLAVVALPGGYVLLEHWGESPARVSDLTATAVGEQLGYTGLVVVLSLLAVLVALLAWLAGRVPQGFPRRCAVGLVATLASYAALAGLAEAGVVPSLGLGLPLAGNSHLLFVVVLGAMGIVVGASYRAAWAEQPTGNRRPWSSLAVPAGIVIALLAVPLPAAARLYPTWPPSISAAAPSPTHTATPSPSRTMTPSPTGAVTPSPTHTMTPSPTRTAPPRDLKGALQAALAGHKGAVVVRDAESPKVMESYATVPELGAGPVDLGTVFGLVLAAFATQDQIDSLEEARKDDVECGGSFADMIRPGCQAYDELARRSTNTVVNLKEGFGFKASRDDVNTVHRSGVGGCGDFPEALSDWCASATVQKMAEVVAAIATGQQPLEKEAAQRVRTAMIQTAKDYQAADAAVALLRSRDNQTVWVLGFTPASNPTVAFALVLKGSSDADAQTVMTNVLRAARG